MNMRWKVHSGVITLRQGSFGSTEPSSLSLSSGRLLQRLAAQHLGELFFVVVVGCASATLYNLIATWP